MDLNQRPLLAPHVDARVGERVNSRVRDLLDLAGPFAVEGQADVEVSTPLGKWTAPTLEEALQLAIDAYKAIEGV